MSGSCPRADGHHIGASQHLGLPVSRGPAGDGECQQIPYARRVPLRARTLRYESVVRNGQLLVWHDAEGSKADLDILPPSCPGSAPTSGPTGPGTSSTFQVAHCREIIDNVVDMTHFFYIHFAFPTNFRNVFEGHMATQFMESTGRPYMQAEACGDEDLVLKSEATYFGPSIDAAVRDGQVSIGAEDGY